MKVLQENGLKAFMTSILNKFIKKTDTEQVSTLDIDSTPTASSNNLVTSGGVASALSDKEDTSNKVTSISSSSTDTQYPSAKCVYDMVGDIETALDTINDSLEDLL